MKKLFLGAAVFAAALVLFVKAQSVNRTVEGFFGLASVESFADNESGGGGLDCRWSKQDCPSNPKEDREVCIDRGSGRPCHVCGDVTRDC